MKLANYKAVRITLILVLLAVPAIFLSGCSAGQVVAPFNPKEVKPEPYTPEPEWTEKSDITLTSIESMKKQAGQTVAPGTTPTTPGGTTPGGTTPGGTTPTPVPGPGPGPAPTPERVPLMTDPIYGVVRDRIEGGVIPGATVTLNERRGATITSVTTNASGEYSFINIPVGYYHVTATANGYTPSPLSAVDLNYFGVPVIANLELVYGAPWQVIEGGNFNKTIGLGNLGYTMYDGIITDGPPTASSPEQISQAFIVTSMNTGGVPDAMQTPFYAQSTQQTYNALLFKDIHGDWYDFPGNIYTDPDSSSSPAVPFLVYQSISSGYQNVPGNSMSPITSLTPLIPPYRYDYDVEPWAEYDFVVPSPINNSYSFDGFWVTFPDNWQVVDNYWTNGGFIRYFFYDWYNAVWQYVSDNQTDPVGFLPFTAVEASTGQVSIRVAAHDSNPYVMTQIRLTYDYRKDLDAPTFYEQHPITNWDTMTGTGSVSWIVKLQEQGFVAINVTGPSNFNRTALYYRGTVGSVSGRSGLPAGSYQYTISASDLPGNLQTYGPYYFYLGP